MQRALVWLTHQLTTRCWLLTVIVLTAITVLSLTPLPQLPAVPGSDKTHHLVAYACLMLPIAYRRPANWIWVGMGFLLWSGAIELIQPYVNRYGEWLDLAANFAGLVIGWLIAEVLRRSAPVIAHEQ